MMMKANNGKSLVKAAGFLTVATLAGVAHADSLSDLLDGLKEGSKASLDMRARYEYNDLGASEVNGYSLRTRLGFTTGEYEGFKAMVEMEDLSFANDDDRPGLDVPTTELNQVWFSYEGAKVGRQVYVLDDQRFIGHVGWRQNIQTYDAISYALKSSDATNLSFAYLDAVHRVNATSQDLAGIVANGTHKFSENFSLTGFAYLLDFDRPVLASSDTFGVRGVGKVSAGDTPLSYMFSYAKQMDNSGSVRDFDVDYLAGELGTSFGGFSLAGGFEFLGGNGSDGFTTPLATVHKFNGFADVFAGPSIGLGGGLGQGLEDLYLAFGFKAGDIPVKVTYHSFSAENVSEYLGSEIDLVATYKVNEYVSLLAKFADYSTNGGNSVAYGNADKTVFTFEANLKY